MPWWHGYPHGQQVGSAVVEDRHLESDLLGSTCNLPTYYLDPLLRVVMKSRGSHVWSPWPSVWCSRCV